MSAAPAKKGAGRSKKVSAAPTLTRREGVWGDQFRAAFTQSKRFFADGVITYRNVADRVAQIVPVTDTTILRLGYIDDIRNSPAGTRQVAYLTMMALGYDPSEFELEPTDRALRGYTDQELRKLLDPGLLNEPTR